MSRASAARTARPFIECSKKTCVELTRLCCVIINPIGAHWGTCAHWLEGFCALDLICIFELIHSWRHPFDNGVVL